MTKVKLTVLNEVEELIKVKRGLCEVSQGELAKKLGVHVQFISNVERGVCLLPLKHYKKAAKALKVPLQTFIDLKIKDIANEVQSYFKS